MLIGTLFYESTCVCDNYFYLSLTDIALHCSDLTQDIVESLFQDRGNVFRMQNAFFYSPTADPVLLRIVYNFTFSENITSWNSNAENSTKISYCSYDPESEKSSIALNGTYNIIHGWTSSGVFTVFHPGVLNLMQLQLPYILLNLIQLVSRQTTDGPEADSFLWDGSYNLPTLHLNLHISSLSCIPSSELLDAVLTKITAQVAISS